MLGGLRWSMKVAQWLFDLESEKAAHVQWMEDEMQRRSSIEGGGYSLGLTTGMLFGAVLPNAHVSTVRAIRERIEYGDAISIGTVNSLVNFMGKGHEARELVNTTIRCAPLVVSPWTNESEIRYSVAGLDEYVDFFEELSGEQWRENSKLLVDLILHAFLNVGVEDVINVGKNEKGFWDSFSFASEDIVKMALAKPERLEDIKRVMEDRKTVDAELIASVLGTEAQALSQGAL